MRYRILVAASTLVMCFALIIQQGRAQGGSQPLPPLPDRAVLDKVIKETGGPTFTKIGVPDSIASQLLSTATALNPGLATAGTADKVFDLDHALYYISIDSGLQRIVIPMLGVSALQPTIQTPGDSLPASIVGAVFDFAKGPAVLVVVWKDKDVTKKAADLRFYASTGGNLQFTTPYKLSYRKLKGNKAGKVAAFDQGAAIAARETCFTVGFDQVCYAPDKPSPDSKASSTVGDAYQALSKVYALKVKFDLDGALPDIAGPTVRSQCADKLSTLTAGPATPPSPAECSPTITFTAASSMQAGQPIGLIHVLKDIDLKAYDVKGNLIGSVPAGNYLIVAATPDITDPGTPGVLFLVNADGKNHYLIPGVVVEGFGESDNADSNSRRGQAAIKDAMVGAYGF